MTGKKAPSHAVGALTGALALPLGELSWPTAMTERVSRPAAADDSIRAAGTPNLSFVIQHSSFTNPVHSRAGEANQSNANRSRDGQNRYHHRPEADGEAGKGCFHPLTLPSRR